MYIPDQTTAPTSRWLTPGRASTNDATDSLGFMDQGGNPRLEGALAERAGYDQLYRIHHARVLRLCRLLLSNPDVLRGTAGLP